MIIIFRGHYHKFNRSSSILFIALQYILTRSGLLPLLRIIQVIQYNDYLPCCYEYYPHDDGEYPVFLRLEPCGAPTKLGVSIQISIASASLWGETISDLSTGR